MKKILVLSGSPRKRDSCRIVKLIEEKMKDLGEVEFEYIMLRKLNIEYCRGCLVCMKKSEDKCPLKDDMPMVRQKMQEADAIIFASPVYIHSVTAPIKNLFDRMAYYLHRPCFHNKHALCISTTELSGLKETLHYLSFPVKAMGFNLVGELGVIAPAFDEPGPYQVKIMIKIETTASALYESITAQKLNKPRIGDIAFFNKLRTKIIFHKDRFVADYEYWQNKGWFKTDYFYPVKINFLQRFIGTLPVKIIKKVLRKQFGEKVYLKFIGQKPESV